MSRVRTNPIYLNLDDFVPIKQIDETNATGLFSHEVHKVRYKDHRSFYKKSLPRYKLLEAPDSQPLDKNEIKNLMGKSVFAYLIHQDNLFVCKLVENELQITKIQMQSPYKFADLKKELPIPAETVNKARCITDFLKPTFLDKISVMIKHIRQEELAIAIESTCCDYMHMHMPYQPETFVAKNADGEKLLLSEKKLGFKPLSKIDPAALKVAIHVGKVIGLSLGATHCRILDESDLKCANCGVVETKVLVDGKYKKRYLFTKFDGDWMFSGLRSPAEYNSSITVHDINHMPLIKDAKVHNWFDIYKEGELTSCYKPGSRETRLFDKDYSERPENKAEVHQAVLQNLLTPVDFFQRMIERNTPDDYIVKIMKDEFEKHQQQLHVAMLNMKSASFHNYIETPAARECLQQTIQNINNFARKRNLPEINPADLETKFAAIQLGIKKAQQLAQAQSHTVITKSLPAIKPRKATEKTRFDLNQSEDVYSNLSDVYLILSAEIRRLENEYRKISQDSLQSLDIIDNIISKIPPALKTLKVLNQHCQDTKQFHQKNLYDVEEKGFRSMLANLTHERTLVEFAINKPKSSTLKR